MHEATKKSTNPSTRSHLLLPRSRIPTGLTQHGTMNPKMPMENKSRKKGFEMRMLEGSN